MISPRTASSVVQSLIAASLGAMVCMMPLLCSAQINAPLTGQMDVPARQMHSAPTGAYVAPALPSDMTREPEPVMQPIRMATPTYQTESVPAAPGQTQQVTTIAEPVPQRPVPRMVPGRLGGETRALMAAQADGRAAGPELPILGPVASASWKRYLDSFTHPIPEAFAAKVGGSSGGSGGN
jgi:hypothetical protein